MPLSFALEQSLPNKKEEEKGKENLHFYLFINKIVRESVRQGMFKLLVLSTFCCIILILTIAIM